MHAAVLRGGSDEARNLLNHGGPATPCAVIMAQDGTTKHQAILSHFV